MKLEFNFDQSGVIPYRKKDKGIEVLLITTMKKKKWSIPKGFIEFNMTPYESAKKEAYEEAGVIGANETIELGHFENVKSMGVCHVKVFAMEVVKILDDYPEKNMRSRKWLPPSEAASKVSNPDISKLLSSLTLKIKL